MPTRLSRYSEGVMEAAWLAAVALVPLFFNVYSSRIFEPDKLTLLRSLALVMLGAWLVKVIDEAQIRWVRLDPGDSQWKAILRQPLIAAVAALAAIFLLSNIFSVTPRISLWGSYQRLQGTYTTFSYLIIFVSMLANLRRRAQVERLITTIILISLPIGLYGILQRFKIDPVPWGGDVSIRVAANMGNSIFVAAYLIMVFPLTLGRIVGAFRSILREEGEILPHVVRATFYVFTASIQLITLYMSGSRGPALGWMAGTFFMAVLMSVHWRKRWMTFALIGLAVAAVAFLIVFQLPGGPLEALRESPTVGRFGHLLDAESNSALVRQYIWEGAADLVSVHEPLTYPDGSKDPFNIIRPLIGYGPESMYVAYNKFYVPELGQVERRNASPDRSHNETWDALVITGILGLAVYLLIFVSVFYYGLKWLGLVGSRLRKIQFLGLTLGMGLVGLGGMWLWRGVEYIGVGLPFGIVAGLVVYLVLVAMFPTDEEAEATASNPARSVTLIALLAAVLAHFVEINFGIAIAATRTYFWTYSALIVLVGYLLPLHGEYSEKKVAADDGPAQSPQAGKESTASRKAQMRQKRRSQEASSTWLHDALLAGGIVGLMLSTVGYTFISKSTQASSVGEIIWSSFTRLPNRSNAESFGVLAMILTAWLAAVLVMASENARFRAGTPLWKSAGVTLGVSGAIGVFFWVMHAAALASIANLTVTSIDGLMGQISSIGGLLTRYYVYIFLIIFGLAYLLQVEKTSRSSNSVVGVVAAFGTLLVIFTLINVSNLRVIHADITFKMAEPFNRVDQWPVATYVYKQANRLAPDEDHYYLFLGRSYLEQAKAAEDEATQSQLVREAEADLIRAQKINPLNTDHTANLARLYSWWATNAEDTATRLERAQTASDYYARALTLSPHNSTLLGEWAILRMDIAGDYETALRLLLQAEALDAKYAWIQGLLGDYYVRIAQVVTDTVQQQEALDQALVHYRNSADTARYFETDVKTGNLVSLAGVYMQQGDMVNAAVTYEEALNAGLRSSDVWRVQEQLARIYGQNGDKAVALEWANQALAGAPDDQKPRLEALILQLQALP